MKIWRGLKERKEMADSATTKHIRNKDVEMSHVITNNDDEDGDQRLEDGQTSYLRF